MTNYKSRKCLTPGCKKRARKSFILCSKCILYIEQGKLDKVCYRCGVATQVLIHYRDGTEPEKRGVHFCPHNICRGCYCTKCKSGSKKVQCPCCKKERQDYKICNICKRCSCRCRAVPQGINPKKLEAVKHPKDLFHPLPYTIGLEFELSEWGNAESIIFSSPFFKNWRKEFDRSVQPSQHELVSVPLIGDSFYKSIMILYKTFRVSGTRVNDTCGYHVHVNGHDLSWQDIQTLYSLWTKYQDSMFKLCHPSRLLVSSISKFCMRNPKIGYPVNVFKMPTEEFKSRFIDSLYKIGSKPYDNPHALIEWTNTYKTTKGTHYCRPGKYYALNLHSWLYRKSVEFRLKEGTLSLKEMLIWPMLCAHFVHLVTLPQKNLLEILHDLSLQDTIEKYMPKDVARWTARKLKETN